MTDVTVQRNMAVDEFMQALDHPLKAGIDRLRLGILNSNPQITEHIKWNAPSFCIDGEDRVTFNLQPQGRAQLVFHRGAKVKDGTDFMFVDDSGLLEWRSADRGIVALRDMDDIVAKEAAIVATVSRWMDATRGH